ncbi:hypothetical protein [Youngiibacter fragilis]|uniref:SnoaL-like domain-containing protein n=1 Tax=Youngiibacter fragilis 232.1 TaxID=994573 RepID=V7I392_9CLOT|nr:hypothetical protein [Youngiibacter fragilis]ETA79751.1 hypothetical protein T472_0214605 [Youngiibacter fragilis 232.1]
MGEIASIDLIRAAVDAYNSNDVYKILAMTADDSVWTTSSWTFRGKEVSYLDI